MKKLVLTLCSALFLFSCNNEIIGTDEAKSEEQILSKLQMQL